MNKAVKITLITLSSLVATLLLFVFLGLTYLQGKYTRVGDITLDINNNQNNSVKIGEEYSISTYNIGFGAYSLDYSFFMDKGEYSVDTTLADGKVVTSGQSVNGEYGKARSEDEVITNTKGSIEILEYLNTDFILLQEVDTKSTRSYYLDQAEMINDSFDDYSNTFAFNFHSGYLPYPIHDFHGLVTGGIQTLSKYKMNDAQRYELPVTTDFIAKFFDLDRCISTVRTPIEGSDKELVIMNVHLSAYDEGGVIREKQIALLNTILEAETKLGNYVVCGGDFNHDLTGRPEDYYASVKATPNWYDTLEEKQLSTGYKIAAPLNGASCRDSDSTYVFGETFLANVDGFIYSSNIEITEDALTINYLDKTKNEDTIGLNTSVMFENSVDNTDTDNVIFKYSDHNAVTLSFKLI